MLNVKVRERFEEWTWTENPFAGKRELQGLKVLIALLELGSQRLKQHSQQFSRKASIVERPRCARLMIQLAIISLNRTDV